MYIDDKTILVAGGTGLSGGGAVRALLAASASVRLRVPHVSDHGAFIDDPRVTYFHADLTDAAQAAAAAAGCDAAILAAAFTAGAQSSRDEPWRQVTDNVIMDARLLEACHQAGIARVIYVSTASVYQSLDGFITEDRLDWSQDPPAPYGGVGWAKRYAEKSCRFWHQSTGMDILIARLANVYGPFAKFDPSQSHFVAALIRKAVDGLDPFPVWGSPDVRRDIIFADDFGRAMVAMLNATQIRFDTFNIGSGATITVGEVVEACLRHTGHTGTAVSFGEPSGATSVAFRALDCTKARDVLGWRAETSVDDGLRQTIAWWQANKETWKR